MSARGTPGSLGGPSFPTGSSALELALVRAARRAWRRRAAGLALRVIAAANAIGAIAALVAGPTWGLRSCAVLAVVGLCVLVSRVRRDRWSPWAAARAFDRQLGLDDRVSSALDLVQHPWGAALAHDAAEQLARHPAHELVPAPRALAAAVAVVAFALAWWATSDGPSSRGAAAHPGAVRSWAALVVAGRATDGSGGRGSAAASDPVPTAASGSSAGATTTPPSAPGSNGSGTDGSGLDGSGSDGSGSDGSGSGSESGRPPAPSNPEPSPSPRPDPPPDPRPESPDSPGPAIQRGPSEAHAVPRKDETVTPLFGEGRVRFELGHANVPRVGHGESARPKSWAQVHREYERLAREHLERPGLTETERDLVRRYLELVRPPSAERR